jgi:hypothetical protein
MLPLLTAGAMPRCLFWLRSTENKSIPCFPALRENRSNPAACPPVFRFRAVRLLPYVPPNPGERATNSEACPSAQFLLKE